MEYKKQNLVIRRRLEGQVLYNDGEFAEVQTDGIEEIDDGFHSALIQLTRNETRDTAEEFRRRFPLGIWLSIVTVTEISAINHTFREATGGAESKW